jgi:hypothetical protein
MNKKSQLMDVGYYIFIFFIFVVVAVFCSLLLYKFNDKIQTITGVTDYAKTTMTKFDVQFASYGDYAVLLLCLGLLIVCCYQAYQKFVNPFFAFIVFIFLCIAPLLAIQLSLFYDQMTANADIIPIAARMPITNYIMNNLGIVAIIYVVVIGIFYFVQPNGGGAIPE